MKKIDGKMLYGVSHSIIINEFQKYQQQFTINTCMPENWNNFEIMIYTKDYQFTLRELGAWRTMLKRVGCHNVTPYTNGEFPVIIL